MSSAGTSGPVGYCHIEEPCLCGLSGPLQAYVCVLSPVVVCVSAPTACGRLSRDTALSLRPRCVARGRDSSWLREFESWHGVLVKNLCTAGDIVEVVPSGMEDFAGTGGEEHSIQREIFASVLIVK